ncbi:unnamed protein product [Litomosoides sigmodontis]|uniref:BTB domain-containing protein n=1 Tax=Litomosoides sigmodontis TaxID=42156 RepID=A0A3P6TUH8_LITSI|nr:unnamed protein product [Litomosoides sigmodontis]
MTQQVHRQRNYTDDDDQWEMGHKSALFGDNACHSLPWWRAAMLAGSGRMLPPILRAQDHCNALVRKLHQCRRKGELLDCNIRVDTVNGCVKQILVHQIIIHCSSNILKGLPCDVVTKSGLQEVRLNLNSNDEVTCLEALISFMYTGSLETTNCEPHAHSPAITPSPTVKEWIHRFAQTMRTPYGNVLLPNCGVLFHASSEDVENSGQRQHALDASSWLQSLIHEATLTCATKEKEAQRKAAIPFIPSNETGERKNDIVLPSSDHEGWCRNKKYIERVPSGYMCTVCQKVYGRYNSVSYHVTIYHRNPPIRCDEEGCKFSTREARYIHFHKFYRHRVPLPENIELEAHKPPSTVLRQEWTGLPVPAMREASKHAAGNARPYGDACGAGGSRLPVRALQISSLMDSIRISLGCKQHYSAACATTKCTIISEPRRVLNAKTFIICVSLISDFRQPLLFSTSCGAVVLNNFAMKRKEEISALKTNESMSRLSQFMQILGGECTRSLCKNVKHERNVWNEKEICMEELDEVRQFWKCHLSGAVAFFGAEKMSGGIAADCIADLFYEPSAYDELCFYCVEGACCPHHKVPQPRVRGVQRKEGAGEVSMRYVLDEIFGSQNSSWQYAKNETEIVASGGEDVAAKVQQQQFSKMQPASTDQNIIRKETDMKAPTRRDEKKPAESCVAESCADVASRMVCNDVEEVFVLPKRRDALRSLRNDRQKYQRFRNKQYLCDICDSAFTLKHNIQTHLLLYHPNNETYMKRRRGRRYRCLKCNMLFRTFAAVQKHRKRQHEVRTRPKCETCQKEFPTASLLREHVAVIHLNLRPFKCTKCSAMFGRQGCLRRHDMMRHLNYVYMCPYTQCTHAGFKCSKALAAHIRSVHTHVRPYKCEQCEKCFVRRNDLRVHSDIHNTECKYICPTCNQMFQRRIHFQKHVRKCRPAVE